MTCDFAKTHAYLKKWPDLNIQVPLVYRSIRPKTLGVLRAMRPNRVAQAVQLAVFCAQMLPGYRERAISTNAHGFPQSCVLSLTENFEL